MNIHQARRIRTLAASAAAAGVFIAGLLVMAVLLGARARDPMGPANATPLDPSAALVDSSLSPATSGPPLFFHSPQNCSTTGTSGRRAILSIGIANGGERGTLESAPHDAEHVAEAFAAKGYATLVCKELTATDMSAAITYFYQSVSALPPGYQTIFFFSGHGHMKEEGGLLHDSLFGAPQTNAAADNAQSVEDVRVSTVVDAINKFDGSHHGRHVIAINACRRAPARTKARNAVISAGSGTFLVFSTQRGTDARGGNKFADSLFARALVSVVEEATGDVADVGDVFRAISKKTVELEGRYVDQMPDLGSNGGWRLWEKPEPTR